MSNLFYNPNKPLGQLQTTANTNAGYTSPYSNPVLNGAGLALAGIQTIGSLWSSFQQNKLAKKSLRFQKDAYNINLRNSTKQYNTSLEDRVRARYATEGRSDQADGYIDRNHLSTASV